MNHGMFAEESLNDDFVRQCDCIKKGFFAKKHFLVTK